MNKIANFPDKDRSDLFRETASKMHTTNAIAEKDFWVVWVLDKIFSDEKLSKILMFKGAKHPMKFAFGDTFHHKKVLVIRILVIWYCF